MTLYYDDALTVDEYRARLFDHIKDIWLGSYDEYPRSLSLYPKTNWDDLWGSVEVTDDHGKPAVVLNTGLIVNTRLDPHTLEIYRKNNRMVIRDGTYIFPLY